MSVKTTVTYGGMFGTIRRWRRATWRVLRWPFAAAFIVIAVIQFFAGGHINEERPWETEYTYGTTR